jgi:transketolase
MALQVSRSRTVTTSYKGPEMRDIFIDELCEATEKNKNIILLVNDLGFGVIEKFCKKFPNNYFNAGISEQSMIGYAAGLAAAGKHVFVYSIANFSTFRCAEQIRNDVDYHNLPVTIVSVGSGVGYGNLGYSHHGLQDYALIRTFPNTVIASPGDTMELKGCMRYLINNPQPSYLRLDKSTKFQIHKNVPNISPGKWLKVISKNNSKKTYLTTGAVIEFTKKNFLKNNYSDYSLYSVPMWGMKIKRNQYNHIKKYNKIIVVEDHFQDGGFQSWLNESLNKKKSRTKIISKSISNQVVGKVGSQEFLMKYLK